MAATNTAAIIDGLERHYQPKKLVSLALQNTPLTAYFPKTQDGSGDKASIRFYQQLAGGVGTNMVNAKAAQVGPGYKVAVVDWKYVAGYWSVENAALKRSEGPQTVELMQNGVKGSMARMGNEIETFLFGVGNGQLGRRKSASTNVITLTNPGEAFCSQAGQVVSAGPNADGSSLRTGTTAIASVDYTNNKVTLVSAAAITSFADNDYLFLSGFEVGGAPGGLATIIPSAAPTAGDNFGGLDRSTAAFTEACAGWRYTETSGDSTLETLVKAVKQGGKFGSNTDAIFISTDRATRLELELGSKVRFADMVSKEYGLSFSGIEIVINGKRLTVMSSDKCPDALGWALERESWKLESVQEPLIAVATKTGKYLDAEVNDELVIKWRSQFQLMCPLPAHNGCLNFVTPAAG